MSSKAVIQDCGIGLIGTLKQVRSITGCACGAVLNEAFGAMPYAHYIHIYVHYVQGGGSRGGSKNVVPKQRLHLGKW